ncbi:hypothetical protein CC86DRAFT_367521 [Ophiobolus disseminans]|uniref:Uncharacterized protein n=1 Tax=Ophiobolus disseminans TaxID=1469910 RepID=A0A6A7ACA0_9PLEO|nr:hypothetical protein CC86DRAFT_367521 [Ophiobolus disseminans]
MASPPPIAHPVPARSPEKSKVNLRHPTPDLQSLQGAYIGNIERLEEHAERMSEAGSDLGEEIRKLHSELKRSDSRRSYDDPTQLSSTRSRNLSTSSHANSIVDLNGAARWGGYSPGGYVTSPVGSLRSGGSFSNPSASIQRQRSESKASRLGQIVHPDEIIDEMAAFDHPGSPQSQRSAPLAIHRSDSPPHPDARKVSSFTRKYDEIANELRDELRNSVVLDHPARNGNHTHSAEYLQYANHHDYPDRPPTAASTDTTRQARTLWQDFDGVHCPDTVQEEEPTPSHGTHSRHSSYNSMMRAPYGPPTQGAPPPDDAMVFYPAPVPRMLNLPKRLSQLPASNIQARRRTQLLDSMQAEKRQSAPLLGEDFGETANPNRKSRQSMAGLPPQLRASAYFDQVAPTQEFAVKGESAKDTLDSILDASARAPVSAFTDHPFAGHVGNEVYGPEQKRKSTRLPEIPPPLAETRRRSSFMMLDTKRNSSGDPLNKLKKRNSSADMNLLILKASESRMSLGDELDERDEHARGPPSQDGVTPKRRYYDNEPGRNPDDVYDEAHMDDEEEVEEEQPVEEEDEEPQYYGAPTTLLAELQLRKAKQKTRNMNYATLVDQGQMPTHRTLLELDDMAEKEKQKRIKKKVNLAWEAQGQDDDSDDDVPLGVLYQQNQQRHQEMDRPVGLIAQREREDREPLSRRRARLRGDSPSRRGFGQSQSQLHLAVPTTTTPGPETDEDEGETLGERMRRLREKKELDAALGDDIRKSTISVDFASEMMSKFGGPEAADKGKEVPKPTPSPGADEEETLGQRRARLQAEAAARGGEISGPTRPGLRPSLSMADVLSANPIDVHNQARKVSDQQLISHLPQGSLLAQNVVAEERKKTERMNANMRASSYGSYGPLIPATQDRNDDDQPLALKIQAYKNQIAGKPAPQQGMIYNPADPHSQSMMPQPMYPQQQMHPMNMGMMSQPNLMMQPQMGMQMPMGMMPMNGMGMQMNGMPMQMQMQMGMGMNGMGMGMMMPPMDPRQRDNITQWMQGIQH